MSHILQTLRNNKPLVIGLVVAPLGLYSGIKIKEWRSARKVEDIKREVAATATTQAPQPTLNTADDIRLELQGLRGARETLARKESTLAQELESIHIKLKRLDEQDAASKESK
ncbi:hypothetical protein GGI13_002467 [Coemansia sp. RSA 455]|nr:hypothetical protein H4S03_007175 [Coemansia sp. S3946]KAJ2043569.1 hypothetical protein H4S04_006691 [Coemansia sp. S16]KAJ2056926.1 hypothetical protein GGI08_003752 [Coemansia sp. S2]KAJ2109063.1 hypothetical protein IW146_006539 [Coemansia sp. RSA 922]KAJ2253870.1 hypothetical protein GGI13_002467 [Coemansia sp. RSA 455]KAJ2332944.1 hypothetical protein GGH92_008765 [Coemansia sp. RSA 2673]